MSKTRRIFLIVGMGCLWLVVSWLAYVSSNYPLWLYIVILAGCFCTGSALRPEKKEEGKKGRGEK